MVSHAHDHICWGGGHHHPAHHHLRLCHVTAGYNSEPALEDINFEAVCGRTLALIGPNGAGKSTLLNALAGLLRCLRSPIPSFMISSLPQDFPLRKRSLKRTRQ